MSRPPAPTLDEIRTWPATVPIAQGAQAFDYSRAYGYQLAKQGQFPAKVIIVGTRMRVVTASLIRVLETGIPE